MALLIHAPVPHLLLWFAMCRAMTVLSYAVTGEMFPERIIGRAKGALSMLHLSAAFVVQLGIGAIVNLWPASTFGHCPMRGAAVVCLSRSRRPFAACGGSLRHSNKRHREVRRRSQVDGAQSDQFLVALTGAPVARRRSSWLNSDVRDSYELLSRIDDEKGPSPFRFGQGLTIVAIVGAVVVVVVAIAVAPVVIGPVAVTIVVIGLLVLSVTLCSVTLIVLIFRVWVVIPPLFTPGLILSHLIFPALLIRILILILIPVQEALSLAQHPVRLLGIGRNNHSRHCDWQGQRRTQHGCMEKSHFQLHLLWMDRNDC